MAKKNKIETAQTVKIYTWLAVGIAVVLIILLLVLPIGLSILKNIEEETESGRLVIQEIRTALAIS